MAEATVLAKKEVGTSGLQSYRFDIVGLAAGGNSPEQVFTFDKPIFTITGLNFACSATNVTLSLFDKTGVVTPSVHRVFHEAAISQVYSSYSLNIPIINNDIVQGSMLYGKVQNRDFSNATGSITCAFLVR